MADAVRGEEKGVNYLDNSNLILIHSRCFGCIFLPKTPALLLLVHQVSATKGFACPPPCKPGSVVSPPPQITRPLCLVIALIHEDTRRGMDLLRE
jgi:hypothetical protein